MSRMSSACTSVRSKAAIRSDFGSSDSRMTRITSSMFRRMVSRPSRMWTRRFTTSSRCWLRRRTVSTRKPDHSAINATRPFWPGRPSRPITVRLTGTLVSRAVWARKKRMKVSGSWFRELGSRTRRTGFFSSDSSRVLSSRARIACLRFFCSGDSSFLPVLGCGLASASIWVNTWAVETPGGSSVTTMRHWPRASCSTVHCARTRTLPRPDA